METVGPNAEVASRDKTLFRLIDANIVGEDDLMTLYAVNDLLEHLRRV